MIRITVITPTYNRANTLSRVFDSLKSQTCKDFEWIVIDDGSTDETERVIEEFKKRADFQICYEKQENNGKHIAVNHGVSLAKGEFIAIADSDDSFKPESFEVLLKYWDMIPQAKRNNYRGITCRCYNPETMEEIGTPIPGGYTDRNGLDATYMDKLNFEMWGVNRTDLMKKFPFPNILGGAKSGLRFFPETVIWDNMSRDYKVRYITECLRGYYQDQSNATTNKKANRSHENIYLWSHYINDVLDYFIYSIPRFLKAFVGISMDGLLIGKSVPQIISLGHGFIRKLIILLFFPAGFILYLKRK